MTRALCLIAVLLLAPAARADEARPKIPDFSLKALSGEKVKLADQKGKVVVMSFWATWCSPCKQELPTLQALLDKHGKDGLTVLAVNTDGPKTVAEVRRFVADKKLTMAVPLDSESRVLDQLNPKHAIPYTLVLDREGRRAFEHTGFSGGAEKELEREVVALLAEKPPAPAAPATP